MKIFLILIVSIFISGLVYSQEKWIVPEEYEEKISYFIFNEDMAKEGGAIYEGSCQSCHGTPTEEDFTLMSPPPGDPASEQFQDQPDGSIFYKIKFGRGAMPGFGNLYSDFEIWSLIAFARSFNDSYKQPVPDLTGVYVPEIEAKIDFDQNVDKIVVKVFDKGEPLDSATVAVYVRGYFGDLKLGEEITGQEGILFFDVDTQLPGDENGYANIIVKISRGYAYKKITKEMNILKPKETKSAIEGRHLWSTDAMAPIWLKAMFFAVIFGVWGILLGTILKLRKLKKLA